MGRAGHPAHRRRRAVYGCALACVATAIVGCGAGDGDERAGEVARDFYAAVAAKDGARACASLGESTVMQLEQDEMAPCTTAVTELKLSGSGVERAIVYVTSAMIELGGGERVFLDRTPQGWKVSAAGCKPQPGEEQPHDCEVES